MRIASSTLILVASFLHPHLSAAQGPIQDEWHIFKTQPEFLAPVFNISHLTKDPSKLAPGYNFIAPYGGTPPRPRGPQIYDKNGEMVWSGHFLVETSRNAKRRIHSFKVCDYQGKRNHLCWTEGAAEGPEGVAARHRIYNNTYQQDGVNYGIASSWTFPSPNEFNMQPGGQSFLQTAPKSTRINLRPYKGKQDGYILDACFQEVGIYNGDEKFKWCYLDHFALWETYLYLNIPENSENQTSVLAGKGTKDSPWNVADINSVDKDKDENFIVSFRHLNQIVKINGLHTAEPGKPIWRLGGKTSDYTLDENALFSRQHHVRHVSSSDQEDVISIFDNQWEGIDPTLGKVSACKIITLNKTTMRAILTHVYPHPDQRVAASDGSCEILPNGNVLVGWGSVSEFTEFDVSGNILYHASYSKTPLSSYRISKSEFDAKPSHPPKLVAYCWACVYNEESGKNPLMAYVSWNGATRVHSYRFYLSHRGLRGPWYDAGTYARQGFETAVELSTRKIAWVSSFAPYVRVEALSISGRVLVNGMAQGNVFVPNWDQRKNCNKRECFNPLRFNYRPELSRGRDCPVRLQHSSPIVFGYMLFFSVISTIGVAWGCLVILRFVFGRCIPRRRVWSSRRRGLT